jgi:hypothetical protein
MRNVIRTIQSIFQHKPQSKPLGVLNQSIETHLEPAPRVQSNSELLDPESLYIDQVNWRLVDLDTDHDENLWYEWGVQQRHNRRQQKIKPLSELEINAIFANGDYDPVEIEYHQRLLDQISNQHDYYDDRMDRGEDIKPGANNKIPEVAKKLAALSYLRNGRIDLFKLLP